MTYLFTGEIWVAVDHGDHDPSGAVTECSVGAATGVQVLKAVKCPVVVRAVAEAGTETLVKVRLNNCKKKTTGFIILQYVVKRYFCIHKQFN